MKLIPLQGVDSLRFGDPSAKAIALFGQPVAERYHPRERSRSLSFSGKLLTLQFDADDRLTFIVALHGANEAELWGERPFEIVAKLAGVSLAVRNWIIAHGRRPEGHQDSFGGSYRVPEEGLIFCISPEDDHRLEGIQLLPEKIERGSGIMS